MLSKTNGFNKGITGTAVVNALAGAPEYTEIFTLSRSQKSPKHPKTKHATLDLRSSAHEMSKSLSHIPPVTHIYFCAYLADPDEAEASRINGSMLSNFLEALTKSGQTQELKRFSLTCGLKQYGVHQGQPKNPMREDDDDSLFWLEQDDHVIGFAKANFMNLATTLGLYCTVSKELEGSKLVFPGNKTNYLAFNNWTSARLHAEFCLWAGKTAEASNQRFNLVNGDTQSWPDLWPRLAARFGCREDRPEVKKAWETVRDRHGPDQTAWDGATWGFLAFLLGRNYSCIASMSKARKLGWIGYADTWDEFERTFKELEDAKMLPRVAG
ncbi:hypothetical protein K449DRAFT_407076 [Hypoxylon sp. EC38]|nr:hypothetical protein K449DRAFT_407076 [Hypoxylon sp. EC38]